MTWSFILRSYFIYLVRLYADWICCVASFSIGLKMNKLWVMFVVAKNVIYNLEVTQSLLVEAKLQNIRYK